MIHVRQAQKEKIDRFVHTDKRTKVERKRKERETI